jgi:hypothetical protein
MGKTTRSQRLSVAKDHPSKANFGDMIVNRRDNQEPYFFITSL